MSVAYKVCDLFDEIQNHYKEFDKINAELLQEFIQEMQMFDGSEKYVREIKKAFERIENSDEEFEEEFSAATDEWGFKMAIDIFKKFKINFEITRKITTDPPVQQVLLQDIPKSSEKLTQATINQSAPKSIQHSAEKIEKLYANCHK